MENVMKSRMQSFLIGLMIVIAGTVSAQVTTASMDGKVIDVNNNTIAGVVVQATHIPSGSKSGVMTNLSGHYTIQEMRIGGPYRVEFSFLGLQTVVYENIYLRLGDNLTLNAVMKESSSMLKEVEVKASLDNNMRFDRSGIKTSISNEQLSQVPSIGRGLNDVIRLIPQGSNIVNGFAVGGGNYRQSYVTVDGAAFNNAFGLGQNLPAGGVPISIDALEQVSISLTPFDVRQSGFIGGVIDAVTKSGTNEFKGSAYTYITNEGLGGNMVGDDALNRIESRTNVYGVTLGGPIIKDKLFFFVSGEYEANIAAGPSAVARGSEEDEWKATGVVHRPTVADMDMMSQYLQDTYNYNPGAYQNYSLETPAYRILGRLDWNINDNNRLNVRFSKTHVIESNPPASSTSPLTANTIYPGGADGSAGNLNSGRVANPGLYFESSRYMQELNFTSLAAEWNSKFGSFDNTLRLTYSYQDEPRAYVGGTFPTVDILKDGSLYASFGPDPFTAGNTRQTKTFIATDEINYHVGIHNLMAGLQFETNHSVNGFMQAANGYYVYSSWEDFVGGAKPAAYGLTYSATNPGEKNFSEMNSIQYAFYLQDKATLSDQFKLTAGFRFELPVYPALENNFNEPFSQLDFNGRTFSTDQVPNAHVSVSPRIGFNWDLTGERKYVLRGGTGYFVGRIPYVWLVSAVSNSNCGQVQYYYNNTFAAKYGQPDFHTTVSKQLEDLPELKATITAPSAPTVIDEDLRMPAAWKTSLSFDAKLPGDIDFSLEGLYNKDFNPTVVTNEGYYYDGTSTITLSPNDTRRKYTRSHDWQNVYYLTNGGDDAYYYSVTASLAKSFRFGLNLSAAYTHSHARSYGDGVGDQVSSAYYNNRYSVQGNNEKELGYGTYVAPNRVLITASYRKEYARNFASSFFLIYEGLNKGYAGGYGCTRFSYTMTSNVVNDYGSNALIYVPASRAELDEWNFVDNGTVKDQDGTESAYTANMQRDDFWAYIEQDEYLKTRKGQYAERGGAVMPWHHQLDFRFNQDFYMDVAGRRHTLQLGVDIKNVLNLLNSDWGLYKAVNNFSILEYKNDAFKYQKSGQYRLTETFSNFTNFASTFSVQLSARYIF